MSTKLVVFDGIDACGKTSVSKQTLALLKKSRKTKHLKIIIIEASQDHIIGKLKRGFFPNYYNFIFLFWMARYQNQVILNNNSYDLILFNRYYDSTYVYQNDCVKFGNLFYQFNYSEELFKKPDLTFILDVSVKEALQRKEPDIDIFETDKINILENRRKRYLDICQIQKDWRKFIIIDTDKYNIEEVAKKCFKSMLMFFNNFI